MLNYFLSVDQLCFDVKYRLETMNKPVNEFLEIKFVSFDDHLKYLRHYIHKGSDKRILKKLAEDSLPLIAEIKAKNIELFKNVKKVGLRHQALKINEKIRSEEKVHEYSFEQRMDTGTLTDFTEGHKKEVFQKYLGELAQWEKLFIEIIESSQNKKKSKIKSTGREFEFSYDQVYDLFHLVINDDTEKQITLFDTTYISPEEESSVQKNEIEEKGIKTLKEFINLRGCLSEESLKKKLRFNCEKWYASLIFDWFKLRKYIPNAPTKVEESGIFFSSQDTLINQAGLSGAISYKLKKESVHKSDYKSILEKGFRKSSSEHPLTRNSEFIEIANFLSFKLYEIFERND